MKTKQPKQPAPLPGGELASCIEEIIDCAAMWQAEEKNSRVVWEGDDARAVALMRAAPALRDARDAALEAAAHLAEKLKAANQQRRELLAALEVCERHSNELFQQSGEHEYMHASDTARAAIAKAKGAA